MHEVLCRKGSAASDVQKNAGSEVQKSECTKECAEKQVQSDVLEGDVLRKCSAREGTL